MPLQELICTQCGSNELKLFGQSAFKCESCGTILVDEKPKEPSGETLKEKIQQKTKEKPFRSKRIQHGLDDQPDFTKESFSDDYNEASNQFMKTIFWIGIVGGIAALIGWLLMM